MDDLIVWIVVGIPLVAVVAFAGYLGCIALARVSAVTYQAATVSAEMMAQRWAERYREWLAQKLDAATKEREQCDPAVDELTFKEALEVMGLKDGFSRSDLNSKYRALSRIAHPDLGGAEWLMQRINAARDVIEKRYEEMT